MATLIPAIGACKFATSGERRVAERLQEKLEDDYLLWYDVPVGPANAHPDFVVLHPRHGVLILEVKDWKLEIIFGADRNSFRLHLATGMKHVPNPLEQARQYAHVVADCLKRDPQLTIAEGRLAGHLLFPWGYGVVLSNITRREFEKAELDGVIEPHHVICKDEMTESVDAEVFQQRLWGMFTIRFQGHLSLPQIDRIRWHMFPEIRIAPGTAELFSAEEVTHGGKQGEVAALPEIMRVMDLQQEQLARSLGGGHRVVHGVAGSGKTLILGYRALHLASACVKPILVLCYNRKLSERLAHWLHQKQLGNKVVVQTFHQWCRAQLKVFHVNVPNELKGDAFFEEMVARVIRAVDMKQIPGGQYDALLIDEGHDFRPEWFKLIVQMVDPSSNSLLVLYDDAQSIYQKAATRKFSFKSVGIEAQGRTTVFKINYRNTREILRVAATFAADLLTQHDADEDHVPTVEPISVGRKGPSPLFIRLPTMSEETTWIAAHLKRAHRAGTPWCDMAVFYREYDPAGKALMQSFRSEGVPVVWQKDVKFGIEQSSVKVMSMHSSKGLEFPLVVLAGLGRIDATDMDAVREEARLLYVAMTRSTHELVMTCDRETEITRRLATAAGTLLPQDLRGLYEYATREIEEARMVEGLWANAGEQAHGVGEQRREIYLAARVNELRLVAEEQLRKERQAG